jgi:dihydroorotate dehydrogenase
LINRLGFNNPGIELGLKNVKKNMRNFHGILGLSIGKNKSTSLENAHRDYIYCLQKSYDLANYIALNISSPNTEGLRDLASKEYFENLINEVSNKKNELIKHHKKDVPVLLKLSPDENRDTIENLINVSLYYGIDGFIVCNTAKAKLGNFEGGLSGKLLKEKSLNSLKIVNSIASNDSLIISSGGISSKEDLIERLDNGANLVQVYTSFVYEGPSLVDKLLN